MNDHFDERDGGVPESSASDILTQLIDCSTLVNSAVLFVAIKNVKNDNAEVVEGAESVTGGQFNAIQVPLDGEQWIVDGRQTGFKMSALAFDQSGDIAELCHEFRCFWNWNQWRRGGVRRLLQSADLGQRVGLERVEVDSALAEAAQRGSCKVLAEFVASFADVLARVMTLHVSNV